MLGSRSPQRLPLSEEANWAKTTWKTLDHHSLVGSQWCDAMLATCPACVTLTLPRAAQGRARRSTECARAGWAAVVSDPLFLRSSATDDGLGGVSELFEFTRTGRGWGSCCNQKTWLLGTKT